MKALFQLPISQVQVPLAEKENKYLSMTINITFLLVKVPHLPRCIRPQKETRLSIICSHAAQANKGKKKVAGIDST